MGILRFNFRSEDLGRYVDVTVTWPSDKLSIKTDSKIEVPTNGGTATEERFGYVPGMKFQTIYLFHGGGDDDSLVYRYTNSERFAAEHCVMTVTPNLANSFGIDTEYGVKHETFLVNELPKVIRTLFPSSDKREDNFIMGYAMGGNAVLGAAVRHPEMYARCVDMSGGIGLTFDNEKLRDEMRQAHFSSHLPIYGSSFGDEVFRDGGRFDLYSTAKKNLENGVDVTPVDIIVGSDEFIRKRVERDVELMKELNYPMTYLCADGYNHDFRLWEWAIPYAMENLLPLKNEPIYP